MNIDWKDRLASLAADMPQGEVLSDQSAPSTPTATSVPKKANIFYERKGRGGKEVTIIADTTLGDDELLALASDLKKRLGTGGSCRGGEILIQGDRRKAVSDFLRSSGFKTNI